MPLVEIIVLLSVLQKSESSSFSLFFCNECMTDMQSCIVVTKKSLFAGGIVLCGG